MCSAPELCSREVPLNLFARLVTDETYSHNLIGPCELAEQLPTGDGLLHAATAALSSFLDCGANAAVRAAARKAFQVGVPRVMVHTRENRRVLYNVAVAYYCKKLRIKCSEQK